MDDSFPKVAIPDLRNAAPRGWLAEIVQEEMICQDMQGLLGEGLG